MPTQPEAKLIPQFQRCKLQQTDLCYILECKSSKCQEDDVYAGADLAGA